jgi:hypothetical protein
MEPEKNDVNISPLFNWGKEFTLTSVNGEEIIKVWLRLVGDADLNRARIYALRKSAEKRKNLRTEDSDDRLAFLLEKGELERERLIAICVLFASKDLAREAIKNVKVPLPKEPKSDAKTELFEKYQKQIDDYPKKREEALRAYISKEVDKLTIELQKRTDDELYNLYINYVTDELCEEEMLAAFKEMCTYFGTYKDPQFKQRFFDSFEDFANLDGYLKQQFMSTYASLDISTDDLKKLQEATH